jgi:hypothetical protein
MGAVLFVWVYFHDFSCVGGRVVSSVARLKTLADFKGRRELGKLFDRIIGFLRQ